MGMGEYNSNISLNCKKRVGMIVWSSGSSTICNKGATTCTNINNISVIKNNYAISNSKSSNDNINEKDGVRNESYK